MKTYRNLYNLDRAESIAPRIEVAASLWARSVGLIGRKTLEQGSGLWIAPCGSIHTFFMRFPIDVLFLNRDGEVLRTVGRVKPWRVCGPVRSAAIVAELPAGTIEKCRITVGARLTLTDLKEPGSER